jgi:hypothetical protein
MVNYCFHSIPPFHPILIQINPVHDLPNCYVNIHFNIIFSSRFYMWYLSFRVSYQNVVTFLFTLMCAR